MGFIQPENNNNNNNYLRQCEWNWEGVVGYFACISTAELIITSQTACVSSWRRAADDVVTQKEATEWRHEEFAQLFAQTDEVSS